MPPIVSDLPAVLPTPGQLVRLRATSSRAGALFRLLAAYDAALTACGLATDWLCWVGTFYLLGVLRHRLGDGGDHGLFWPVCAVQFAAIVVCLYLVGGYDCRTNFTSLNYMSEHCITLVTAAVLGALVIYVGRAFGQMGIVSIAVLLGSQLAFAPTSLACRRAVGRAVQKHAGRGYFLVLGAGKMARQLFWSNRVASISYCLRFVHPTLSANNVEPNRIDPDDPGSSDVEVVSFEEFAEMVSDSSGVVIGEDARCLSPLLLEWLSRLHYEKIRVYTLETFYGHFWRRVPVRAIDATWPLQLEAHLAHACIYAHAKRLMDIVLAGIALLILLPLLALLALIVYLESGGPTLFRQTRVGRDRRPFTVYKFRTMYNRPADAAGSLYTATHDPRITRTGRWLRKLHLDELPQLWNVLRGDMSLIGPRAEWDRLVDRYETTIPFYHFRHLVKPGITGWAQVNYPYGASEEDAVQKLKYDLYYIRHYSLRLDAMIVLKTLHTMLWGKGT